MGKLTGEQLAKALTQDEVNALQTGTEVMIRWSGGNGPYLCRIVNEHGMVWAESKHSPGYVVGDLSSVGNAKFDTVVFYP